MKRVFLFVLDSVGIGHAPDAAAFGDEGAHTLRSLTRSSKLIIPTLLKMGLGNIPLSALPTESNPTASVAVLVEQSKGKDTTTGHWELMGLVSKQPFPTYPDGFPDEILRPFCEQTGRGVLCNRPYSGTQVIADYGEEHQRTGNFIVYTSADSVFQTAAHVDTVPLSELYAACETARRILQGKHGVGRVIARPFTGTAPSFERTADRRDFSLPPPSPTVLDALKAEGMDCIGVGKIGDIFAERGLTECIRTHNNAEGMACVDALVTRDFRGLCFVNLVDFDMNYGHRNDVDGYAAALSAFDRWLSAFLPKLAPDDAVLITADHGCDPAFPGTDHTRERVPLLVYGKALVPENKGQLPFAAVGRLVQTLLKQEEHR